jgi:hypothetical protein
MSGKSSPLQYLKANQKSVILAANGPGMCLRSQDRRTSLRKRAPIATPTKTTEMGKGVLEEMMSSILRKLSIQEWEDQQDRRDDKGKLKGKVGKSEKIKNSQESREVGFINSS